MQSSWFPLLFFALVSCGPGLATESDGDDGAEPDPVATACEALCARISQCSSGVFAENWLFETEPECADNCRTLTYVGIELGGRDECIEYGVAFRECGAVIEDCQVFQTYEDFAFGIPTLKESPCIEEQYTWLQNCN